MSQTAKTPLKYRTLSGESHEVGHFSEIIFQELPAKKIDGNSESEKNKSANVHDRETTLILNTDFSSNTDSVCAEINRQVSYNRFFKKRIFI